MYEVWRPVPDWEGLYEASSLGNVRSLPRQRNGRTYAGRLLKPTLNPRYLVVGISDATTGRRKSTPVHVLVAAAFLGPRPKGVVVRHGPGGHLDNSIANLSYGTQQENIYDKHRDGTRQLGERCGRAKLTSSQVMKIRTLASSVPLRSLARQFQVSQRTIQWIVRRRTWAHLP
jgi:hypothetical protein